MSAANVCVLFFASGKREGFKSVIGAEGIDVHIAIFRNELLRVNPVEKFRYPDGLERTSPSKLSGVGSCL